MTAVCDVVMSDETKRKVQLARLARLNAEAKALSRRGYVGSATAEYAGWHQQINELLSELERT